MINLLFWNIIMVRKQKEVIMVKFDELFEQRKQVASKLKE